MLHPFAGCLNELINATLLPGCHHLPIIMPDCPEAFKLGGIAPDKPALDQLGMLNRSSN
ncbi:MAG TPA: hypothetical protein VGN34_24605 [Ktedonobacteraceae bacterium]